MRTKRLLALILAFSVLGSSVFPTYAGDPVAENPKLEDHEIVESPKFEGETLEVNGETPEAGTDAANEETKEEAEEVKQTEEAVQTEEAAAEKTEETQNETVESQGAAEEVTGEANEESTGAGIETEGQTGTEDPQQNGSEENPAPAEEGQNEEVTQNDNEGSAQNSEDLVQNDEKAPAQDGEGAEDNNEDPQVTSGQSEEVNKPAEGSEDQNSQAAEQGETKTDEPEAPQQPAEEQKPEEGTESQQTGEAPAEGQTETAPQQSQPETTVSEEDQAVIDQLKAEFGMTEEEIAAELDEGKTLAEILDHEEKSAAAEALKKAEEAKRQPADQRYADNQGNVLIEGWLPGNLAVEFEQLGLEKAEESAEPVQDVKGGKTLKAAKSPAKAAAAEEPAEKTWKDLGYYDIKLVDFDTNEPFYVPEDNATITLKGLTLTGGDLRVLHILDSAEAIAKADAVTMPVTDFAALTEDDLRTSIAAAAQFDGAEAEDVDYVYVETLDVLEQGDDWIKFATGSFSIYVVVDTGTNARVHLTFMVADEPIAEIDVKQPDTVNEDNYATVLYDPGVGDVGDKLFKGWTTDPNYTTDYSGKKSIDDIRTEVKELLNSGVTESNTEVSNITYYAMLYDVHYVTYRDEFGNVTVDTIESIVRADQDVENKYTVNMSYTPSDPEHFNFEGWALATVGANNIATYVLDEDNNPIVYENGVTELTLTSDIVLRAYCPGGNWITFKEQGGTYTGPEFVHNGDVSRGTAKYGNPDKDDPTRYGYSFNGWYRDAAGTTEYTFNQELTEGLTLYAKWDINPTADYTVIVWKQALEGGDNWDFEESHVFHGNTNDLITIVSSHESGYDAYARINGENKHYTGFHLESFDSEKRIAPEGTTVVNVYYVRNQYTFTFEATGEGNVYSYNPTTKTSDGNYYVGDTYEYVYLYYSNGKWYRNKNTEYEYVQSQRLTTGNYYIPDGNSENGYSEVYLYRHDNKWYRNRTSGYVYEETNSTRDGRYYIPNGSGGYEQVQLYRNGGRWYRTREWSWNIFGDFGWNYSNPYDGPVYIRSTGDIYSNEYDGDVYDQIPIESFSDEVTETVYDRTYGVPVKTITALYGQSIADQFPITIAGITYDAGQRWKPENGHPYFNQVVVLIESMPECERDCTFTLDSGSGKAYYELNYYVEALPSDTNTIPYQNLDFVLYNKVRARINISTAEDFIDIAGFSKAYPASATWNGQYDAYTYPAVSNYREGDHTVYVVNFYYTRNQYEIVFKDGIYLDGATYKIEDGSGTELKNRNTEILKEKANIHYGEDISSYNPGGANYYKPAKGDKAGFDPTGYVFVGWYVDTQGLIPYTFDKMPEGGVVLYAKWVRNQYRVFLHPNGTAEENLRYGADDQQTSFRISYGDQISDGEQIHAYKDGHELVGWYTDSNFRNVFTFSTFVANDTNVPDIYDKSRSTEIDMYGNPTDTTNKDVPRFWIERSLDLYARWRSVIEGAEGINVEYDANGGSGAPSDSMIYADQATATARAAATAPENTEGKVFQYWIVQDYNDETGEYVDTDIHVLPGNDFTIKMAYAKVTDITDGTQTEEVYKKYTIRLIAYYAKPDEPTPTHMYWYKNDGTVGPIFRDPANYPNTPGGNPLAINEAVDIKAEQTRTGYYFKGWALITEPEDPAAYNPNNVEGAMLVYWDPETKKYYSDAAFTKEAKQVAADEDGNTQVLIAVWEPYNYTVEFNKNAADAEGTMDLQEFEYDEQKALTANAFTRVGYTFDGWNTKADGSGYNYSNSQPVKNLTDVDDGTVTLYAKWKINSHNVIYSYTGTVPAGAEDLLPATTAHDFNSTVTVENEPELAGYTFSGWTATPSVSISEKSFTMPDSDVTFTGSWTENEVTITYVVVPPTGLSASAVGTVSPESETVKAVTENAAGSTATPKSQTYKLEGWYKDQACTQEVSTNAHYTPIKVSGLNVAATYYAKFVVNEFEVSYEYTGTVPTGAPDVPPSADVICDTVVTVADDPTMEGYTFSGWVTEDATVSSGKFTMPANDVVLKGSWTINSHNVTYTYTGDVPANPTELPDPASVEYNTEVTVLTVADVAGYTFEGWTITGATAADGKFNMPDNDVSLVGNWTQETVDYHYVIVPPEGSTAVEAGTLSASNETDVKVVTGIVTGSTATPTTPGFVFVGWYDNETCTGTALTTEVQYVPQKTDGLYTGGTFYAKFDYDEYTVTYSYEGDIPAVVTDLPEAATVKYKSSVTVANEPAAVPGYTFEGWKTSDATISEGRFTMPAKNVAITGKWTLIPYTATFIVNGGSALDPNTDTFTVVEAVDMLTTTRPGWTFEGWKVTQIPTGEGATNWIMDTVYKDAMPASGFYGDVTFTAVWSQDLGRITITKSNAKYANETFLYKVESVDLVDTAHDPIELTVMIAVDANGYGQVVLADVPYGTYKVTCLNDWSWRYADEQPQTKRVPDPAKPSDPVDFPHTNGRDKLKWLDGFAYRRKDGPVNND